jgi:alkylation response protein AidB-like acyl-CoA dehydrogenase
MTPEPDPAAVDLARTLAADIATRADEADRLGCLPLADVALLKSSGYLALAVPAEYGGQGLSLLDCVAAEVDLAKGSASTALVAAMQHQVVGHQREVRSWRPDAYERIMREAAGGGLLNSLASEPALGSPSRGGLPETNAKVTAGGDQLIINGRKTWSTGGHHLTHLLVRVRIDGEAGVVLVRQGTPGVEWIETWSDTLSLRASESHDAVFHDVVVPGENLIETGEIKSRPNVWFPMMLSAVYLGASLAARDAVIRYALEREPTALGRAIATLPKIQRQIGEIDVILQSAQTFLLAVAGDWHGVEGDRDAYQPRIAAAKMTVMNAATTATDKALEVAGGAAITRALPLERYFRDVRAGLMQPPAGDTALEMVGRAALGL